MISRVILTYIFFNLLINVAYCQSDNTELASDSIVFVPDTIVIKSTFYLHKSKKTRKDSLDRYVGIGYSFGKSFINPNTSVDYSNISCVNVYIGKKVKNLYADIGIGFMSMAVNSYTSYSKTKQGEITRIVLDTIDTYFQGGVPVNVTEPKEITTVYAYQQDSTVNNKIKLTYLQIPLNITYLFSFNKLRFGPQLGIKTCFLLNNINSYSNQNIHTFMMYASGGLSIGYQASKKFLIEAVINQQFSLSKSSIDAIGTLPFQNIGLGAKYFF